MSMINKGRVVVNAWARKCDNYRLVALLTDSNESNNNYKSKSFVNILNMNIFKKAEIDDVLQPPGLIIDNYQSLTDKVFLTFIYLHRKFLNKYDWFLKADDDTFIFVDHLREFLIYKNASEPVSYG